MAAGTSPSAMYPQTPFSFAGLMVWLVPGASFLHCGLGPFFSTGGARLLKRPTGASAAAKKRKKEIQKAGLSSRSEAKYTRSSEE